MANKKQDKIFYAIIGVLVLILIVVVILIFGDGGNGQSDAQAVSSEQSAVETVAAPAPHELEPTHQLYAYPIKDNVSEAITLKPQYGNKYPAEGLFDNKRSSAWVIGEKEYNRFESNNGTGAIPYLNVGFEGSVVDYAIIRNGYGKSNWHFSINARPRSLQVLAFANGSSTPVGTLYDGVLSDTNTPQRLNFNQLDKPYDYVRFVFDRYSIYRGTKYQDICVDEITLFGR